jgi:hypothetical protein
VLEERAALRGQPFLKREKSVFLYVENGKVRFLIIKRRGRG